jgi:hypothetical protein
MPEILALFAINNNLALLLPGKIDEGDFRLAI